MKLLRREILILLCSPFVGCRHTGIGAKLTDSPEVARVEASYKRLYDIECGVDAADYSGAINNAKLVKRGDEERQLPGWIFAYYDLRHELDVASSGDSDQIELRRHLIRKFGVISALVKVTRHSDIELYVSPVDRFALSPESIAKICNRKCPRYSSLARFVLMGGTDVGMRKG